MENLRLSRRSFCINSAKITAGLTITGFIFNNTSAAANQVTIDLSLSANNALTKIGGALYVTMPSSNEKVIVVRNSDTEVSAFSSVCTHQGCTVNLPVNGTATCPCHGSQFSDKGVVVKGPASSDLKKYIAVLQGNFIYVSIASTGAREKSRTTNTAFPIVSWQKETLSISWSNGIAGPKTVSLFDTQGRRMGRLPWDGSGSFVWPTGRMPRGEYVLKIEAKGEKAIIKKVRIY
jgi:Rieske Fe-S protein